MSNQDDEPRLWVTVLKLVLIAVVLIGGTGLALWYVDRMQVRDQPPGIGSDSNKTDWGIAGDNPLRKGR